MTQLNRWIIPLGLAIVIVATYANALRGPFIFDDIQSISLNEHVRALWPLTESMSGPPKSAICGRPLVCLSLALNYALGGENPVGYHVFNVAIHVAAALLLYGLIRRTMLLPKFIGKYSPAYAQWFAAAAALIWAVHPIQTESIDYVTQRTETLESMFLLLMLYCMTRDSKLSKVLAVFACAAGMACKEQMAVAPLIALLYDWVFISQRRRRIFYGALFACWLILPLELQGIDWDSRTGYGLKYLNHFDYLKTQTGVIFHYLRLCFWPSDLVIDYTDWPITRNLAPAIVPGLILLSLLIASIVLVLKRRWEGFVGLCFFLFLGPTSSFLPNFTEVAAERRMYLASVPVVLFTLAAIPKRSILVGVLAIALAATTIARNHDYRSTISIWTDAITKRPNNWHAHYFLAYSYAHMSDWKNAKAENAIAMKLQPNAVAPKGLAEYVQQHESDSSEMHQ